MFKTIRKISYGLLVLSVSVSAIAQSSGGDFVITKHTIDGGGGTSDGGDFSVTGTVGQPDASTTPMTGEGFSVSGGFWPKGGELPELIFSDSFEPIPQPDTNKK